MPLAFQVDEIMRTLFLLVSVPLTLVFFSSAQQANRPGPLNLRPMPSYYQLTSDQMAKGD